jgi:hypothetical protein
MTAPQPEKQSNLEASVATPDDAAKEGEKLDPPPQIGSAMGNATGEVKTNACTVEIVDEIMPGANPVSEPPSCSSSTATSPTSPSPTPADYMEEANVCSESLKPELQLQKMEAIPKLQATITEQEQRVTKPKPGGPILEHEATEPVHEGMKPDSVLSKPGKSGQLKPEDTQPEPMQHCMKTDSAQGTIRPALKQENPESNMEETSPLPNQEDLSPESSQTGIKPESNEKDTISDQAAERANIPSLFETHSSLSSYIKRSLSGLFSDIATLNQAAHDIFPGESSHEQPLHQADDYPTNQLHQAEVDDTELYEGHEDVTDSVYESAPVRKRSRLDLTIYQANSEPRIVQDSTVTPSSPHQSRGMSRRRSFSYRCLAKLFHINDDTPTDELGPSETVHFVHSPRTVAGPTHTDEADQLMMIDSETPFKIAQPPLEESESMSSFIQVLGAVDLDSMGNDEDDTLSTEAATSVKLSQEGDSFGWYVSEESRDHPHMTKEPPSTFLSTLEAMEESLAIDDTTCPIERRLTPRVVKSLKMVADGRESSSEAEDPANEKSPLLERLTPEGELMGQKNEENPTEETILEETSSEDIASSEAELEYARAADTVDSVLGDFFC